MKLNTVLVVLVTLGTCGIYGNYISVYDTKLSSEHAGSNGSLQYDHETGTNLPFSKTNGTNITVSVDCLRCLCLSVSDCLPLKCRLGNGRVYCGYFLLSRAVWIDCDKPGSDFQSCGLDFDCSSLCIQRYMQLYATDSNCPTNCESYTRILAGGPSGCNNPFTENYWRELQKVPGCKGVQ